MILSGMQQRCIDEARSYICSNLLMKLIAAIALFLIACPAVAQFKLNGRVLDENGSAIAGATVYLSDLKKGAVADEMGRFSITNLPGGKFLLEVRSLGYGTIVQLIEVPASGDLEIRISSAITELNEIVVSGVSHSTELKKNPMPVATLNAEALLKSDAPNIIDNIAQKPGVFQVTTGTAISKPVVRGLGGSRVITLYDGIRQEGQQWGEEHGVEVDEYAVDRVEIIKGAGSLLYGSDGIGGVINLLPAEPASPGTMEGQWLTNYQTNNGLIANSIVALGQNSKGFYGSLRGTQKAARAYRNKLDHRVVNSGFREMDVTISAGVNKAWGYTQLLLSSFDQHVGLTEGERDMQGNFLIARNVSGTEVQDIASDEELKSYQLYIPKQRIQHHRISSNTTAFFGRLRLQVNAAAQRNRRREFGNVLMENNPELSFDLQTFNYNSFLYFPEKNGWDLSFGVSGMLQKNLNQGVEFIIPEYQMSEAGAVVFLKKHFDKIDVAAGVRFDHRALKISPLFLDSEGSPADPGNGIEKFKAAKPAYSNYSASAGLSYEMSDLLTMKGNISRGYRAPNISELSSHGIHEGSLRFEYGNYDLEPETSFQSDVSLLLSSPHVLADLSIFSNRISNYVYARKLLNRDGSDSIPDPDQPFPAYEYVQGQALLFGGEFTIDLHPHPLDWLHFENSFSFVSAENKSADSDSSRYLPFTPAPRWRGELRATARRWKCFANMYVKLQFEYHAAQNRVFLENQTESPTSAYSLWNVGIGVDVRNRGNRVLFSFLATAANILDTAYQSHLSRMKYAPINPATGRVGIFNMGRNFSFKLIVPFSGKLRS